MYKYILILFVAMLMSACQDRYRYPCQDPKNFNKPECSFEICKETHECPNYVKGEHDGK